MAGCKRMVFSPEQMGKKCLRTCVFDTNMMRKDVMSSIKFWMQKSCTCLYDQRDRVVFMQDGNQRAKSPDEWAANLYDELDRPIITTLYHTN